MQFELSTACDIRATKILETYREALRKYSYDVSDENILYISIDDIKQLTEFINDIECSIVINKLDPNDEYGICIYDDYLE